MTRPQALLALQQTDNEIDSRLARIAKIEAALGETEVLREAGNHLAAAENSLKLANSHLKDLEYQAQETQLHADTLEKRLYGGEIKGAKEAEKAQSEIATFRARRKQLDEEIVAAQARAEDRNRAVNESKEALATQQAQWEQSQVALQKERDGLESELPVLQAEREKRKQAIVSTDLVLYEKLRTTKNGLAVVPVENSGKICGKCRVDLPATKIQSVKNPAMVVTCPSCGRILFYK